MKTPEQCPDNEYTENKTFELINKQVSIDNSDAFLMGSIFRYANRRSLAKLIAHFKIYELIKHLPGHIVELGVFKGESLLRFAQLVEIFEPYDRSFEVIGFDNFEGFTKFNEKDGVESKNTDKVIGGWSSSSYYDELLELINIFDHDRFAPQKRRINLIKGDILNTVPEYSRINKHGKIRLLHLDADLYEPTKVGLENLWDLLIPGGVLLLDQYGFDVFPGEAAAVDEFFLEKKIKPEFKKFKFTDNPGAYVIKKSF